MSLDDKSACITGASRMRLDGKLAFITGASRGIGRELAVTFAEAGANLLITYNSTEPEETLNALSKFDVEVDAVKLNVSDSSAVNDAVKCCIEKFGQIDILVNNAGVTKDSLVMRMKDADWDDVLNTNLKGAFNTIRAVSKQMIKKRAGKIVNIGSVVGAAGNPGQANYSASKAGLAGLTMSVARELATRNIQINLLSPGYIDTDMTDALGEKARDAILSNIPMNRMGKPREVADAALFLSSAVSDYITGQVIHVNGGLYM